MTKSAGQSKLANAELAPPSAHSDLACSLRPAISLSSETATCIRPAQKAQSQRGRPVEQWQESPRVNEIWTVDFKGWWHGTEGRCEPLTVRDEFSRYLLELRRVPNARSQTVQQSFEKLFERHGLPEAIRSDNGAPFASRTDLYGLSRLSAWWIAFGNQSGTRSSRPSPSNP
jgi:transposase InsO family protein